ncbi:MAG TPA: MerR family DNA-binding transcriptional regulator, partial [Microbacterium sp.]|nr:MerR family DNA-binding transcriptional regulator [Microbacterium sp.]
MDAGSSGEVRESVAMNVPESMAPWLRAVTGEEFASRSPRELMVGEVASLVGISIRTLHHWDAVGLVVPDGRTA